jgi:protein-S-isoprenylcysteine O-methyltransferase Ste14
MLTFILKLIIQTVVLFALIAAALFISAGTIAWAEAWVFFGLFFVFFVGVSLWLFRVNPSLANERMRLGGSNQQGWDRVLFPIMFISPLAWLVLSALDVVRFKWSHVPLWVEVVGGVLLLLSFFLFFLTFRENSYLSPLARVQKDRGQKVISTGPYAIIRHPMYLAFLPFMVGTPLMLGSWFAALFGAVFMLLPARRAVLEERMLVESLEGYKEYMDKVKFRLIPHVW